MVKRTFLYDEHLKLNAKMVDFAGWEMPVQYHSIIEEHNNVRKNAGIFDVSHMGEIFVSGKESLNFIQYLVPQNIEKLTDGKAMYCQLTNTNGGIVDDLLVYKLKDTNYLLVVNASRVENDYEWIIKNKNSFDVIIENKSDIYSMIAIQGPKASDIIEKAGLIKEEQPKTLCIKETSLFDSKIYISRTGYTGEDGFEIIMKNEDAVKFWNLILKAGEKYNLLPVGLGARDTLRLEAAMSLYGNELNETTTPIEANLSWSVDKNKKENYIGKKVIESQLANGTEKKLIAFKMIERAIARHEYEIMYNNENIGKVTSGGFAPSLGFNIGLGYIKTNKNLKNGDIIQIMVRNKLYNAQITNKNFIIKHNKGN